MTSEIETERIDRILETLTLEEKVRLCHASTKFTVRGVPEKGVPDIHMSDGPHGVRREIAHDSWDPVDTDTDLSTYLPTGTALAATWNPELAYRHGAVLGAEARERGKDIILGPGFNIIRSPLCGRNFEYYTEDPFLNSVLVQPAVKGIQSQGTAACAKHFACNSQELNRNGVDALPSERALREIYLPAFKAAVDAGVLTVMGAYNKFRGQWCCQNDTLLNRILKDEWGFDGLVVSDWNGVNDTYEAANCGLEIEMGTEAPSFDAFYLARPFLEAVGNGEIEEAVLDDKVRRILRVLLRIGAMGGGKARRPAGARNTEAHYQAARDIAREAIVLLKNTGEVLPLKKGAIKKLLIVGDNAVATHHSGGASSAVKATYEVTPLEGLRRFLGDSTEIEYVPDPQPEAGLPIPTELMTVADTGAGVNGWRIDFFRKGSSEPVSRTAMNDLDLRWDTKLPRGLETRDTWEGRARGTIRIPESGTFTFILDGARDATVLLDGKPLILRFENEDEPERTRAKIPLKADQTVDLEVIVSPHNIQSSEHVSLRWLTPGDESTGSIDELLKAARAADAVLYVGGLTHRDDTEGKDKLGLELPGEQDALIPALAKANPAFAAVMISGSPYTMPWIDSVPAIVQMWYAGMEGGNALAEVLFGAVNPSGKLPFTFPCKLEESPAHALHDYAEAKCYYKEDLFVGYRWNDRQGIAPLFPFGHGLSYTTFQYTNLAVAKASEGGITVSFNLTNTGEVPGSETAQVYVGLPTGACVQPIRQLKGFRKAMLDAGEGCRISLTITEKDLQYFHPTARRWQLAGGTYKLWVGASSRDLQLEGSVRM